MKPYLWRFQSKPVDSSEKKRKFIVKVLLFEKCRKERIDFDVLNSRTFIVYQVILKGCKSNRKNEGKKVIKRETFNSWAFYNLFIRFQKDIINFCSKTKWAISSQKSTKPCKGQSKSSETYTDEFMPRSKSTNTYFQQ